MKGRKDETPAEDLVRMQLTVRALVWDAAVNKEETALLERELGLYEICCIYPGDPETEGIEKNRSRRVSVSGPGACEQSRTADSENGGREHEAAYKMKYDKICRQLDESGYADADIVLITDDAQLSSYVHSLKKTKPYGMAVVYYEKIYSEEMLWDPAKKQEKDMPDMQFLQKDAASVKEQTSGQVTADMIVQGFEEIGVQFLDRILKRRNKIPWTILYTERTSVREIALSDLDELYELYEGEGITDYTEPLYERRKEEEYTQSYIDYMYYYYGYGMWIVRDRNTGKLIGRAGIEHHEEGGDNQDGGCSEVWMELGYLIGKPYQNKGYAAEVCRAVIAYAREELGISRLHCFIHPENKASIHLAEKLGFSRCRQEYGNRDCRSIDYENQDCGRQDKMIHFCMGLREKPDCSVGCNPVYRHVDGTMPIKIE